MRVYFSSPKLVLCGEFWWCCPKCARFRISVPTFCCEESGEGSKACFPLAFGSFVDNWTCSWYTTCGWRIKKNWKYSIPNLDRICSQEVSRSFSKWRLAVCTSKSRAQQLGVQKVCQWAVWQRFEHHQCLGNQGGRGGGREEAMKANRKSKQWRPSVRSSQRSRSWACGWSWEGGHGLGGWSPLFVGEAFHGIYMRTLAPPPPLFRTFLGRKILHQTVFFPGEKTNNNWIGCLESH